jgi:hypothetical protein
VRSFERALQENPAPRSVGDVQLRSDPPVLVGETRRPPERARLHPELWLGVGLACGVGVLAALMAWPGSNVTLAAILALIAGVALAGAGRAERNARQQRRFVLHFGNETLRVDLPGRWLQRPRSWSVHFDEIRDLYVLAGDDGSHSLIVEVAGGAAVLVDRVEEAELDELRRLWSLLRAAFGLTRLGTPTEAGS